MTTMKKARNTTGKGYFKPVGSQVLAKKILAVRLPVDMDAVVREVAKDDLSGWLREAIAEKLAREQEAAS